MSRMVSTCSMSTGHCSTQAPQVVQDQSTSSPTTSATSPRCSTAGSWPSGVSADASPARNGAFSNRWSRRSVMTSLGESGLPVFQAGHWSWQRPHSVQVVRSRSCFQVKSSTLPAPKTSSSLICSGSISGVDSGPSALGRREKAQRRRGEPVEQAADGVGGEGRAAVGEGPARLPGTAVERQGDHHPADHRQDHPGLAGVGLVEAGGALEPLGRLAQPDGRERQQAQRHGHGGQVLQEAEQRVVADQRQGEALVEQLPVRLQDGGQQDQEAPQGEEVGQPWHGALEQLALAEHLGDLGPDPAPGALEALGRRLADGDQAGEPLDPSPGKADGEEGDHGPDGELHEVLPWRGVDLSGRSYHTVTTLPSPSESCSCKGPVERAQRAWPPPGRNLQPALSVDTRMVFASARAPASSRCRGRQTGAQEGPMRPWSLASPLAPEVDVPWTP